MFLANISTYSLLLKNEVCINDSFLIILIRLMGYL